MTGEPAPSPADAQAVLSRLRQLEASTELSIVKLGAPPPDAAAADDKRISDASSRASLDNNTPAATPAALAADLAHYRELFAKLRFSYVEQVTKEKFIRSIVQDPPLVATLPENQALEAANLAAKARLRTRKADAAAALAAMETHARALASRLVRVRAQAALLASLPGQSAALAARVAELRRAGPPPSETSRRIGLRRGEHGQLARELEALRARAPRRRREAELLRAEMAPLEARRAGCKAAAGEARRRRDAALGGGADDLEHRARWWRATEAVLRALDRP